ncbi:MAG: hypothetical protein IJI14_08965 [Anaerolineaceae bacterium]|nr:hypothetical protein [Anaerolineaceae bacterium]
MNKKRCSFETILIWLWFIFLAILFTRPLLLRMGNEIAGEVGDNIYFIWMIGWVKKALFKLGVDPMNVWFLNYPEGWNMAHTEITPAQLALSEIFTLFGSETFAYNAAMLLSFVLSGAITFYWVRHLTGSAAAGVLSGTIYACLPYRQAHFLAGHLNLSGTQWLPLFFWGWFDLLSAANCQLPLAGKDRNGQKHFAGKAVRVKAALMAAVGLGLTALTSQYYFFMMVIVAGLQMVWMLLVHQREKLKDAAFWKSFGLFILFSIPLLLIAELPFLQLAGAGGMPDRDWGGVRMYSAGLSDYLLPGTTHFLFGKWVGSHFNRDIWIEATLYVGIAALALFLYAMISRGKQIRWERHMLVTGIVIAVVLSMGTDLHWNAEAVELTLPGFLSEKLGRETLPILLPGFFFFKFVPFYAKLRAMMRFGIFALLFVAAGAGFALTGIEKYSQKKQSVLIGAALLLVVLDFLPRPQASFAAIGPRQVDLWIAQQPETGSVMRYPFRLNDDQAGTYYTLYNEKPFIGGFFNAFPTEQYQRIRGVMDGFPSEESLNLAKELDVSFFLVEEDELNRAIVEGNVPWGSARELYTAAEALGLKITAEFDGIKVFMNKE